MEISTQNPTNEVVNEVTEPQDQQNAGSLPQVDTQKPKTPIEEIQKQNKTPVQSNLLQNNPETKKSAPLFNPNNEISHISRPSRKQGSKSTSKLGVSVHSDASAYELDISNSLYLQSASTLQHSSKIISFSKAPRFSNLHVADEPISELKIPSSLGTRSTSMGLGGKIVMSEIRTKESKLFPGPNQYSLRSFADDALKKKFTFGEGRAALAKSWIPGQTTLPPDVSRELPGPGEYNAEGASFREPKITLKAKGKLFNDNIRENAPPPGHYTSKYDFVENGRFNKISFGFGHKHDFTKSSNRNPGPGTYKLPSIFDKYDKSRYENSWRRKPPLTFDQA